MQFEAGERIQMAEDWRVLDAENTLLASKGDRGTVTGFWKDRKGGEHIGYQILLDSGQELGVSPREIEAEVW